MQRGDADPALFNTFNFWAPPLKINDRFSMLEVARADSILRALGKLDCDLVLGKVRQLTLSYTPVSFEVVLVRHPWFREPSSLPTEAANTSCRQKRKTRTRDAALIPSLGKNVVSNAAKIQWVKLPRAWPSARWRLGKISEMKTQITAPWPIAWAAIKAKIQTGTIE